MSGDIRVVGDGTDAVRVWLDGVRDACAMMDMLSEDLEAIHARRTRITSVLCAVSASGGAAGDMRQNATIRLIEVERRLQDAMAAYARERARAEELIAQIRAPKQREVMHRRYIMRQRFSAIARAMDMSERQVYKAHRRGICAMGRIWAENASISQKGAL